MLTFFAAVSFSPIVSLHEKNIYIYHNFFYIYQQIIKLIE